MVKKSKNTIKINWDEEEGGKFIKNPGEYIVLPISVEQDDDDDGKIFLKWTFEVQEGKAKGASISTRTYVTPKALWKLRELLTCMGIEVPQGSVQDLDLDEVIDEASKFVIEVEEGNERADGNGYYMQVSDYMALEDYKEASATTKKGEEDVEEDTETEEEEVISTSSKKADKARKEKKKSKEVDEEELLDQMEEEIDELGLDIDLDDYDTFEEKKEAFEKAKKKASKKSKKVEEDEEEEEEDSEEQHYTVDEIEAFGTKQLKQIASEIGLELDEEASTRSKRRSVIAGLRKAGLLDE